MQSTHIENNKVHQPELLFAREMKRLFCSPHFIIFLIVSFSFLSALGLSFIMEWDHVVIPLQSIISALDGIGTWGDIFLAVILFTILATAVMFIGFIIVWIGAMTGNLRSGCKVGYYIIKITKMLQHIFLLTVLSLVTVRLIVEINRTFEGSILWDETSLRWISIFVTVFIAGYLIFFHLKTVITVSVMKEAVVNATPIRTSIFTAVGYFILTKAMIITQFFTGFNLTVCLGCICSLLFGIHILKFRCVMAGIENAE